MAGTKASGAMSFSLEEGPTGIDVACNIHVGFDIGTGSRQKCHHLVEGGHGGRVAGTTPDALSAMAASPA